MAGKKSGNLDNVLELLSAVGKTLGWVGDKAVAGMDTLDKSNIEFVKGLGFLGKSSGLGMLDTLIGAGKGMVKGRGKGSNTTHVVIAPKDKPLFAATMPEVPEQVGYVDGKLRKLQFGDWGYKGKQVGKDKYVGDIYTAPDGTIMIIGTDGVARKKAVQRKGQFVGD